MTIIKPLVANIKKTAMAVITLETLSCYYPDLSCHICIPLLLISHRNHR
jgi:hypothetical protein